MLVSQDLQFLFGTVCVRHLEANQNLPKFWVNLLAPFQKRLDHLWHVEDTMLREQRWTNAALQRLSSAVSKTSSSFDNFSSVASCDRSSKTSALGVLIPPVEILDGSWALTCPALDEM